MRLPINIEVVFPEGRDKMALNTNGEKVIGKVSNTSE